MLECTFFNLSFIFETCHITSSPQNVQWSAKSWFFFHWSGCHTVNFSSHPPRKSCKKVLFKMFSIITIDKQFDPQVVGFHISIECPMRPGENKMSLSQNFFPSVWHFFHLLLWQLWCCFGWPLCVRQFHSDDANTLSMWSCKTEVDEVHSIALKYQNLEILCFCVPPVWLIIFHRHTDITTWNKANNTSKILISKIKYLKMLKIYLSIINIKFQ